MIRLLQLILFVVTAAFFLTSCGQSPPTGEEVNSDVAAVETVGKELPLDILEEEEMKKDVVYYTAEASPEAIDAEKLPEPEIKPVTEFKKATVGPKPAAKPEKDVLKKNAPATAETPAPKTEPAPAATAAVNPSPAPAAAPENPVAVKPDHAAWNALLQQYVNAAGNVNYAGLKQAEGKLDAYLAELNTEAPGSGWNRTEAMAYWINAYNAGTVKLILKNWPVKSITDLHGGKPWDVKWLDLGGKTYSLNQIENEILRPRYKDPRIHFAVNCAAASCPPLANQAFTATNLNALLEARAKAFIRNGSYNTLGEPAKVSKIFEWYGEDFGDLRTYLNKYAGTPLPEGTEIQFKDYDWALNKQ